MNQPEYLITAAQAADFLDLQRANFSAYWKTRRGLIVHMWFGRPVFDIRDPVLHAWKAEIAAKREKRATSEEVNRVDEGNQAQGLT